MSSTGMALTTNSISMLTALLMMSKMHFLGRRLFILECRRHAKLQWSPSSWLINSLLKLRPGMRPRFLSQNITQKEPEKKMPSTVANAIICSAKLALTELHHLRAQLALRWTHDIVSIAWSRCILSAGSLMYVSMRREYVLLWMFSTAIWKL